jgi:hypothetical protein
MFRLGEVTGDAGANGLAGLDTARPSPLSAKPRLCGVSDFDFGQRGGDLGGRSLDL